MVNYRIGIIMIIVIVITITTLYLKQSPVDEDNNCSFGQVRVNGNCINLCGTKICGNDQTCVNETCMYI